MTIVTQLSLFDNLDPQPKRCNKCGETYPLTNEYWNRNKTKRDGFADWCKQCSNQYNKKYKIENPQKAYKSVRDWQLKNPHYNKNYYQNNLDNAKKYARQYRENHIDQVKKREKAWRKNNPNYKRSNEHKRYAKKKGNGGSYTPKELKAQFDSQQGRCYHCGKWMSLTNSKTCHIDHWIPISKGGSNNIDNIKLLCVHCNLTKHNKLPCEWHKKYCQ